MGHPDRFLRILSVIFAIVAWCALAIGLVGGVSVLVGMTPPPRPVGLVIVVVGALYFCLFSALSGIIRLLLTLEERTRAGT